MQWLHSGKFRPNKIYIKKSLSLFVNESLVSDHYKQLSSIYITMGHLEVIVRTGLCVADNGMVVSQFPE